MTVEFKTAENGSVNIDVSETPVFVIPAAEKINNLYSQKRIKKSLAKRS